MIPNLWWFFGGLILGICIGNKKIRDMIDRMIHAARNAQLPPSQAQKLKGGT